MLDLILSYLAKIIAECLELIMGFLLPVFGFDFDTFAAAFPFAASAYYIFQKVALSIALAIGVFHLMKYLMSWFGVRVDQLKSSPIRQLGQVVLSVIFIYYGNYVLSAIIDIARLPFNALLNTNVETNWNPLEFSFSPVTAALHDFFYSYSVLLYIILILLVGFSMIKVVLEAVERYIILYVLIYLSPLAAASIASEETSGIYKKFFSMFISQCLLLLLNVWSVKMGISMLSNLSQNATPVLGLLMGYGFLRVAQKMDSYLNQLGLNAAITGAGLGMELMATGAMLMGKFGKMGGAAGGAESASGGAGGILGASKAIGGVYSNLHPLSFLSRKASGFVGEKVGGLAQMANAWGADAENSPWNVPFAKAGSAIKGAIASGMQRFQGGGGSGGGSGGGPGGGSPGGGPGGGSPGSGGGFDDSDFFPGGNHSSGSPSGSGSGSDNFTDPFSDSFADSFGSSSAYNSANFQAIGKNPQAAAKAFNVFQQSGETTYESQDVGAVMKGMGAGNGNPTLKKFVDVANGKSPAKNASFSMGPDGINGQFEANGQHHKISIVNAQQHASLPDNLKKGYQRMPMKSGETFYYKTEKKKL